MQRPWSCRLWQPEAAEQVVLGGGGVRGGSPVPQEECKTFGRKVRARPDQTGSLAYVDGDDSHFPAEETEDTER